MTTLVDANVLLDLTTNDPVWESWSIREMRAATRRGVVAVNPIIYAEISVGFERREELDDVLAEVDVVILDIPRPALFLAGKAFRSYRGRGGSKTGVLPDFFISAHASVAGILLFTRDARRHRTYFPDVELIAPEP